jgi:hypothetical protein
MQRWWRRLLTSTSDVPFQNPLIEVRRVRLERLLQIASHDFELRFEFGKRDVVGKSHIILKAEAGEVIPANINRIKGRVLNLLGHALSESWPWHDAAVREEAQGNRRFSSLWHALEDARVDNLLIQRWPGSIRYCDANLLPNMGGRFLKRMPIPDQIEHGLYLEGRGYKHGRYLGVVRELLDEIEAEIDLGAHGASAQESYSAMLAIYPKVAHWLRSGHPGHAGYQQNGDEGEDGYLKGKHGQAEDTQNSPEPEIETGDELFSVEVKGRQEEFPEWYRPGSAPWFERGLGKKEIHPQAVRSDRQTIITPPEGDLDIYRTLRSEMRREVGFLSQRLTNLIREEVYLRFAGYHRTGRLNKAKLWKQRIGNYRLFQRPTVSSSQAVAFTLLVDESASMKGKDKYKMAIKAALLLGETLDLVSVPLEIIGYSTVEYEARAALKLGLAPAYLYRDTRCSPLEHRVYKRFNDPYFAVRARLTKIEPRHNNWDEESLMFAFHRMQTRAEPRKVMIVICDGQPNGDADYLIKTVKWIEGSGCKLIGIGIDTTTIKEIYTHAVVVTDFRQMAEELLEILAREFRPSSI